MILVEGGTFTMGTIDINGEDSERPAHTVTVDSFKIAQIPTTYLQWKIFSDATGRIIPSLMQGKSPDSAMGLVNWFDADAYCQWLSAQTGQRYRLPTEAEWEYAASGGKLSEGYLYSGSNHIDEVAWYKKGEISEIFVAPVAQKKPNELGLYDMSGNVWEWCSDWYAAYTADTQTNPHGPEQGEERVQRGGSCTEPATSCRITARHDGLEWLAAVDCGFRVVLSRM